MNANVIVFYDQNGDGQVGTDEPVRLPGVQVDIEGRTATSAAGTGGAVVSAVPAGAQTLTVTKGLPPYYVAPAAGLPVEIPPAETIPVPITLPIGTNGPNTYMAFGDSITFGDGSSDGQGYRGRLQQKLQTYFNAATMFNDGIEGGKTERAVERIQPALDQYHPAYAVILYGTNDWNLVDCQMYRPACLTIENLRTVVRTAVAAHTLPILGTIIPSNPGLNPPERNVWVAATNDKIRQLATEENVTLADPWALFPTGPELGDLFADHVHPNDAGHELIARAFFAAISGTPASATATAEPIPLGVMLGLPVPSSSPSEPQP